MRLETDFFLFTIRFESSDTILAADRPHVQHVRPQFSTGNTPSSVGAHEMGIVALGWCGRPCGVAGTCGCLTGWRHSSGAPGAQAEWSCLLIALKQLSNRVG